MGWFYTSNGEQFGPWSETQVRSYISSGKIRSTDKVKPPGSDDWIPATDAPKHYDTPSLESSHPNVTFMPSTTQGQGSASACIVLGVVSLLIGLYFLFNPTADSPSAYGLADAAHIVNIHKLTLGETFSIMGAIFLAAGLRPRS